MKIGSKIEVTETAKYNGKDMEWTETFTGKKEIKNGELVFHYSNSPIKEFLSKEICVSPFEHGRKYLESNTSRKEVLARSNWTKYIYAIFLPKETIVDTYSDDEYRFHLNNSFEVEFVGTVIEANGETFRGMTDAGYKEIFTYLKYSNCKIK